MGASKTKEAPSAGDRLEVLLRQRDGLVAAGEAAVRDLLAWRLKVNRWALAVQELTGLDPSRTVENWVTAQQWPYREHLWHRNATLGEEIASADVVRAALAAKVARPVVDDEARIRALREELAGADGVQPGATWQPPPRQVPKVIPHHSVDWEELHGQPRPDGLRRDQHTFTNGRGQVVVTDGAYPDAFRVEYTPEYQRMVEQTRAELGIDDGEGGS